MNAAKRGNQKKKRRPLSRSGGGGLTNVALNAGNNVYVGDADEYCTWCGAKMEGEKNE